MSSCVICVVIAIEIFLLQSDCPEITKCTINLKTTIKTEILSLSVVDDQDFYTYKKINIIFLKCHYYLLRMPKILEIG